MEEKGGETLQTNIVKLIYASVILDDSYYTSPKITMPFSNDKEIPVKQNPAIKRIVLITGVVLFIISLFNTGFCTVNGCRTSMEAFLIGWLAILAGGAALSWLANPFLMIAWILLIKNKNYAWLFGLIALLFSGSFLTFHVIVENEGGGYNPITKIGTGYWLWLASCCSTFAGALIIRLSAKKNG